MGNSPSVSELPPEWEDILPNITREAIMRSSHKNCRVEEDKSVYLDDDLFDLDEHVPTALAVLRAAPHLKDIRFRLVPGTLTEERYWAALFGVLQYGGIDIENVAGKIDDDYETGDEGERYGKAQSPPERLGKTKHDLISDFIIHHTFSLLLKLSHTKERAYYEDRNELQSNSDATNTPPFYLEEIKAQQAHIHRLQKSLREANHRTRKLALELHKERKKRHDEDINDGGIGGEVPSVPLVNGSKCTSASTPLTPHKGTWEMHRDCKDFLELDDHLKDNLRKEKQKRLDEVRSQMKFILDTDDIKDSYGKWSCCGKEEYTVKGCE